MFQQEERMPNGNIRTLLQPVIHCHLRFGAALVVDVSYLIVWIPVVLVLTIVRSYRRPPQSEDTHQDYYMHTETIKDPFSTMNCIFTSKSTHFRSILPIPTQETLPLKNPDDMKSEFQKALAASMTQP
jgi:hypothetical protein